VAPPRVKDPYLSKLRFAHSHGFRFVRHHSHVLPDEYFDSSDEVGVLISPELPCVYKAYYDKAGPVGLDLYARTWTNYIKRLRNHPSIFDWAMCNEYATGIKQGPEL
jgi:beta-galactosidase/beta-glucuronidase